MRVFKLRGYVIVALLALVFASCKDSNNDVEKELENKAPTAPVLKEPANNAENIALKPTFMWDASVDPEKGEVLYELFISKDKDFKEEETKKAIDIKENSFSFANYELERSTTYYWKVVASDVKKAKAESAVASFMTVGEDLNITLSAPMDKAVLTAKDVELSWTVERSPLYKDEVTYQLFLRNGSAEFSLPLKKNLTETKVAVNGLKGNGHYYWAVSAVDKGGNEVAKSATFTFTTPNTPPSVPMLNTIPVQKEVKEGVDVSVEWSASKDEDRVPNEDPKKGALRDEKLTYDVYLSTDKDFSDEDIKKSNLENTENLRKLSYTFPKLPFETAYWVKVVVKDENGAKISSNVITFTTKKKTETGAFTAVEGTWTDTRDGKTYKTITIDGKTWLAENFAYLPYAEKANADGNKMTCSVYGETSKDVATLKANANYAKYGVVYSGYAVADIAPEGWHVATDEDWQVLEKLSGMTEQQAKAQGYKNGKRGATMHKFIKKGLPFEKDALDPTDEMKLSVTYGGYLSNSWRGIQFKGLDKYTYFWTSSKYKSPFGGGSALFYRAFSKSRNAIERGNKIEKYGMYVRLVKD